MAGSEEIKGFLDIVHKSGLPILFCSTDKVDIAAVAKRYLPDAVFMDMRGASSKGIHDFFDEVFKGNMGMVGVFEAPSISDLVLRLTAPKFGFAKAHLARLSVAVFVAHDITSVIEVIGLNTDGNELLINQLYSREREGVWKSASRSYMRDKLKTS
jgi:hypothetical protein